MNLLKSFTKTPTSKLMDMQRVIETELNRRAKLCEICSSTLLVKDIGLRVVTRTTLFSDYREWTGIDGYHHQQLTVKDLLLNLPPTYWSNLHKVSPRGYKEVETVLLNYGITLTLFSIPTREDKPTRTEKNAR